MRIIVRKPTPQMARALLLAVLVAGVAVLIGCPDAQRGGVSTADAGSEAPQADARPRHVFCATLMPAAQRCADFEEGELLAGWDSAGRTPNPGEQGGGILEELLEPDGRKVLARTPAIVTAGQRMAAVLLYTFPSQTPRLSVVAKLNVVTEDIPGEEQLAVMSIVFGDEGAVVVARDRQGATIQVVPNGKGARFPSWPAGTAHDVGIAVATGSTGFALGSIDSTFGPELLLPAHFAKAAHVRVAIGPTAPAPMGAAKISIDNVAIRWGD